MGIRIPAGCFPFACLAIIAAVPATALAYPNVLMETDVWYTQRATGATDTDGDGDAVGAISSSIAAPGIGSAAAEAYANEGGTFWVSAYARSLEPYEMIARSLWDFQDIRPAGADTVSAQVTGTILRLTDYGSVAGFDLRASVTLEAYLDTELLFIDSTALSGRGGFNGGNFTVTPPYILSETTIQPSGYVSEIFVEIGSYDIPIDISGIPVGTPYSVRFIATATAANAGGETTANAWFRDPFSGAGGISIAYTNRSTVPLPASIGLLGLALIPLTQRRIRRPQAE